MDIILLVTGDDEVIPVTLTLDKKTFNIDPTATVQVSVTASDKTILIPATPVLESQAGSDWANSLLIISLPSNLTSLLEGYTKGIMEIQVDDGGKETFFGIVKIEKGTI